MIFMLLFNRTNVKNINQLNIKIYTLWNSFSLSCWQVIKRSLCDELVFLMLYHEFMIFSSYWFRLYRAYGKTLLIHSSIAFIIPLNIMHNYFRSIIDNPICFFHHISNSRKLVFHWFPFIIGCIFETTERSNIIWTSWSLSHRKHLYIRPSNTIHTNHETIVINKFCTSFFIFNPNGKTCAK